MGWRPTQIGVLAAALGAGPAVADGELRPASLLTPLSLRDDPAWDLQPEPPPQTPAEAGAVAEPVAPPEPGWIERMLSNWTGEVRFGAEVASGNNDRSRFRGGFDLNRASGGHSTRISSDYVIARSNAGESENRLVSRVNQDWATGGSKFSGVFLRLEGDADRLQDFDYRLSVAAGAKYTLLNSEKTNLEVRVGGSARREFGARSDDIIPEGAAFLSLNQKLSARQRLTATVDYLPEIERPRNYRINSRAAWDIDIDPEAGLGLRLTAENRYDARPSRQPERNDFDFAVLLFWKL